MDPDVGTPDAVSEDAVTEPCYTATGLSLARPRCPAGRRRSDRRYTDTGLAEFVVCLPVFFLLVVGGIQYALWSHASHLARSAAEQGSQVASGYGSTPAAGSAAARNFIASTGPGTLTNPQVSTSTLTGDVAQVTVTGRAQALIPWLDLTVSATSNAPVQEYRTSG
jgi:Flp pilus assembly protein TadG